MKYLLLSLFLLSACSPEIRIVEHNNTITEIVTIDNTKECPDCVCNYPKEKVCPSIKCDNSDFLKCQLQNGRYANELKIWKNLTDTIMMNSTYDEVRSNLTFCLEDKNLLKEQLNKINKTLRGE